jgi:tripartite-type tricarboxylate transporter receptor subunit TctC
MSQLVFNPILYPNLPYDPMRDLEPIGTLVTGPMLIASHPDFGADSLPIVLDLARKKPGEIQVAVPGEGSPPRIVLEMLMKITGTRFSVVPFRGGPEALVNVINGQIPLLIDAPSIITPHLRSGKLKAVAVTGQKRIATLPGVPTVAESGYPDLRGEAWIGLVAPAGMPRATFAHLCNELARALAAPDLMRYIEASGARVMVTSSEEFSKMISEDRAYWARLIEASGLRVQ